MSNSVIAQYWRNADGQYHREDGPAFIGAEGHLEWYMNGMVHRIDGPAVTWFNGDQGWYLNNERIFSNKQFQEVSGATDEDMTMMVLKYGNIK